MASGPLSSLMCPKWTNLRRRERSQGKYGPSPGREGRVTMARPCQNPTIRAHGPVSRVHADVRAGDPHAGQLLAGRYRLSELVARGATGRVWRAYDEILTR